jgi:hypothetical protein
MVNSEFFTLLQADITDPWIIFKVVIEGEIINPKGADNFVAHKVALQVALRLMTTRAKCGGKRPPFKQLAWSHY